MPAMQDGNREIVKAAGHFLRSAWSLFAHPFPFQAKNDKCSMSSAAHLHPNSKISFHSDYSCFTPQNMGTPGTLSASPIGLRTYIGGDSIGMG